MFFSHWLEMIFFPSKLILCTLIITDPHIRVGGSEEGVVLAKTVILEHLDTKTRRVTMKMYGIFQWMSQAWLF